MIIRSLRAQGFMRYELLELSDLPRGVIALVGENEAGKSTVGEAIAFSIFGRTIRTEDTDPTQAIHWDADECQTAIDVELPPQGVYRIERRVTRTGEFEARLTGPGEELLAEGTGEVALALQRLLGYDFSAFRYSFYVAQGELDLLQRDGRDNSSRIVCDMLGVSTIERASVPLEKRIEELKERASMLDRDLIVARALHTESLPIREEIATYEGELARAQQSQQAAEREASRAEQAYGRWDLAAKAQRARARALTRLEGAMVADAQKQRLLGARGRLVGLAARADELVERAERTLSLDEKPREKAKQELAKAEAVGRAARRVLALVEHRAAELEREVGDGPDALEARRNLEAAAAEKAGKSATWSTLFAVLALLLALVGGGVSAGYFYGPQGRPLLEAPPKTYEIPQLGIAFDELTREKTATLWGGGGGLLLLLAMIGFVRRSGAKGRQRAASGEASRLAELRGVRQGELEACRAFSLDHLGALSAVVAKIDDAQVKQAYDDLRAEAGESASADVSPDALYDEARQREAALDATRRSAEPRLAESRRVAGLAKKALEQAEASLAAGFPDGLPEAVPDGDAPDDLEELAEAVEEATGLATQARVEFDVLVANGQDIPLGESTAELRDAIASGIEAVAGDQAAARARYEEQSGLAELLKARDTAPTVDALRAVLKRERELLDEVFGSEDQLRTQLLEVEEQLRIARVQKAAAEAELAEAVARGARVEVGRRRLAELERKIAGLEEVLAPTHRELQVTNEAIHLLGEVADALKARFAPGISRYIEVVLPRITDGRYRRTRVSDDLEIRIYSTERGDYVRLIDLSLGTADQVLVSLRLGLARALLSSRGIRGGHFLFMDEPLVSADEAREQAFFDLLRTFDDEFAQIFVTSPRRLSEDGPFARRLDLTRAVRVVRLEAGAKA